MQNLKKIRLGRINRWDKEEEKVSEFECTEKENIQYEKWDKRLWKNEQSISVLWDNFKKLVWLWLKSPKGKIREKIYVKENGQNFPKLLKIMDTHIKLSKRQA